MTDTPRTDEAEEESFRVHNNSISARAAGWEYARELERQIAELTEWRPMETAPEGMCILRDYNGYITLGNGIRMANTKLSGTDELWHTGWLPLPKGTET